jgi:hypothetical protein
MLLGDLHGHREIIGGFLREEDLGCLLLERRVGRGVVDLDDVKLWARKVPRGSALQNKPSKLAIDRTLAPAAVLTAKEKSLVSIDAPSNLKVLKAAA